MSYLSTSPNENHEFAFSEAYGGEIHISKVKESGRQDFSCLGCKKPMQAILRKICNYKPYFRHHTKDVEYGERCTYRDDDHRRKIAWIELELYKQISVPPLYKVPPKGTDGLAIFLLAGETVYGAKVTRQQYFYDDVNGNVHTTSQFQVGMGNLLYYADAVFYNADEEPLLLVVFSDGKRKKRGIEILAGLSRLRINTVQVIIPKESPEAIQRAIRGGKNTKWLYHDDERRFDYFSLSGELPAGIPAADIDQGQLFEESCACRKAQINNLIRAINKCLGAEPYHRADEHNRRLIGETEFAIGRAEERRNEFEEQYREGSKSAHRGELDAITGLRNRLGTAKTAFSREYQDLEERYQWKKCELEEETRVLESNIRAAEFAPNGGGRSIAERRSELECNHQNERRRMDELFKKELRSTDSKRAGVERTITSEKAAIERLQELVAKEPGRFERAIREKATQFDQLEANEAAAIEQLQTDGEQLAEEFEELRRQTATAAENRNAEGTNGLSRRLKALLDARGCFVAIEDAQSDQRRHRAAKKFLESPAFQTWVSKHQH